MTESPECSDLVEAAPPAALGEWFAPTEGLREEGGPDPAAVAAALEPFAGPLAFEDLGAEERRLAWERGEMPADPQQADDWIRHVRDAVAHLDPGLAESLWTSLWPIRDDPGAMNATVRDLHARAAAAAG